MSERGLSCLGASVKIRIVTKRVVRTARTLIAAACLGMLLGCAEREPEAPVVESVDPDVVAANVATPADVTGRHFLASPRVDLSNRDSLKLERGWGVAIDDEPPS